MKYILTITLALFLSSPLYAVELEKHPIEDAVDSSRYTQIYLQDGSKGYQLECSGLSGCYAISGELCKTKGYTIINRVSKTTPANTTYNSWIIKCNE
jgi:hypothetical protein